jgi:hypothetical protein
VFLPKLFDYFRAAGGEIAENAGNPGFCNKVIYDSRWKSFWKRGKRLIENYSRHLPMTRGRVFPVRPQGTFAEAADRVRCRRQSRQIPDVA